MLINIFLSAAVMFSACQKEPDVTPADNKPKDRQDIVLTKTQQQIGYTANTFTFDFLKAAFRNGVEPDAERAIKAMNGKRYGYSGNSGCLHADYQVHFDLAR